MRPINGLYVLRLTAVSGTDPFGDKPADKAANKDKDGADKSASSEGSASSVGPSSALGWRLLCRLRFDGGRCGSISGGVRIIFINERGERSSDPGELFDARLGNDGTWSIDGDGTWSVDAEGSMNVDFSVIIDNFDCSLVGAHRSEEQGPLANITLRLQGTMAGGLCVGKVAVLEEGTLLKTPVNDMRLVMQEVTGARCAMCHDPVSFDWPGRVKSSAAASDKSQTSPTTQQQQPMASASATASPPSASSSSSTLSSSCQCVDYCSAGCRDAHALSHASLCAHIKPYANGKGNRCTAMHEPTGKEFSVYWRSLGASAFNIFVDATPIVGTSFEIFLDLLVEARLGSEITFKGGVPTTSDATEAASASPPPTTDLADYEVIAINHCVFEAVIRSAITNGCVVLAASCLNHLHVWCPNVTFVERQYLNFYDVCVGGGWEGQRVISTLGEYVMLVRPMYECATVLIEAALKSLIAGDFWYRLENAKGVLISLYNINGSVTFTPSVQHLRNTIVPEQQRETLLLLAKVFIMMAVRTSKDQYVKMLRRAEECYTDAMEEDRCRNNFRRMGYSYVQLSALYLMFPNKEDQQKAAGMREQGLQFLAQSILRQSDAVVLSAITSTIGLMEELGSGMK